MIGEVNRSVQAAIVVLCIALASASPTLAQSYTIDDQLDPNSRDLIEEQGGQAVLDSANQLNRTFLLRGGNGGSGGGIGSGVGSWLDNALVAPIDSNSPKGGGCISPTPCPMQWE